MAQFMSRLVAFLSLIANNTDSTGVQLLSSRGEAADLMRTGVIDKLNHGHLLFVLLLMAQFQLWDGLITQVFVSNGLAREANRFMVPLIANGSFLPLKLLGGAAALLALLIVYKRFPRMALAAASLVSVFYVIVIVWNFSIFFQNC